MLGETLRFMVSHHAELLTQTGRHLLLTVASLLAAIVVAVPLGILLTRRPRLAGGVLGAAGVLQTIPSLALLGFLLPLLGIGGPPAVVALFLYALLPIVRNTFTGVDEVEPAVKKAARGMGMSDLQVLRAVELPLAMPVIFAGVRTAAVINVGVATLCALIGAGGLGVFIFRGISLNDTPMLLAGALPAAALALAFDACLALVQRHLSRLLIPALAVVVVSLAGAVGASWWSGISGSNLRVGMAPEFMERADGYQGFRDHYDLPMQVIEIDHGLMYQALHQGKVDAVVGYSTDGEIAAFELRVLEDDRHYFPPYHVSPLVRGEALAEHPELRRILGHLDGVLDDAGMAKLNARVDQDKEDAARVAGEFLAERGLPRGPRRRPARPDIVIGSKIFAEQYILAEIIAQLIEGSSTLSVGLKTGLGGTKICFDALRHGEIDLYPEYTGTGLLAILEVEPELRSALIGDPDRVLGYVRKQFRARWQLEWLEPLGFNNSYALIMTRARVEALGVQSVSDVRALLAEL